VQGVESSNLVAPTNFKFTFGKSLWPSLWPSTKTTRQQLCEVKQESGSRIPSPACRLCKRLDNAAHAALLGPAGRISARGPK
jgi:hypothetical protein